MLLAGEFKEGDTIVVEGDTRGLTFRKKEELS
jgi:hypothetical protein